MDDRRLGRLLDALHGTSGETSVLHRICTVCTAAAELDGAGISRLTGGRHEVLAASGPQAESIEHLQVSLTEGPCLDAIARARPALEPDLTSPLARKRWPRFATAAAEQGVLGVYAFPLLQRGRAIGALDVYSRDSGEFPVDAYDDALLLAGLAALALVHHDASPAIATAGLSAEPIEPWAYPAIVHQASGMVAEQLGLDVDDALLRLRAHGFVTGAAVVDVARDVVTRRVRIESWSDDV